MDSLGPDQAANVVQTDQECMQCGYNLRGLPATGRCPECGQFVNQSMRGDLLRYANPEWLGKVKIGLDLMYYSIVLTIFLSIFLGVVMAATGIMLPWVTVLLQIAAGICSFFAVLLITIQEPRVSLTEKQVTWRRVVRSAAIANFGAMVISQTPFIAASLGSVLYHALLISQSLFNVVLIFGYFAYAESFAPRIPDAKLARSTRIVKWGLSIPQAFSAVTVTIILVCTALGATGPFARTLAGAAAPAAAVPAPAPSAPGAAQVTATTTTAPGGAPVTTTTVPAPLAGNNAAFVGIAAVGCVGGIWMLIFGLWALRVLLRFRTAFKLAVAEATAPRKLVQ